MAVKAQYKRVLTRSEIRWKFVGIMALTIFCLAAVLPNKINLGLNWVNSKINLGLPTLPQKGFNLGLDLQGGAHLIYEANTALIPAGDRPDAVEGVRDVIERRVRGGLGVAEPLVQTTKVGESFRIIVELPGVTDVKQAIQMIGETPVLAFKEINTAPPRELTKDEVKQLNDFNTAAEKTAREAVTSINKGMTFAEAVNKYSQDLKTKNSGGDMGFVSRDAYPEIYDWAKAHGDGAISFQPIKTASGYNVVRRVGERDGEKQVSAAHLLICYKGATGCTGALTQDQAKAKIEEIKKEITTQNFVELVKKYSTEPGAAERGGDLGTFKKGAMVPEFEKAIWDAPVNTIIGPVETAFGYHLIFKKGEVVNKEYSVSRIFIPTKQKTDIVPPPEQWKDTGLSGKQLKRAEVTQNQQTGEVQVSLQFNDEGGKLFGDITGRNVGKQVAIFLDGEPISEPRVNEAITSGSAVITGGFTLTEAKLLAQRLNSGALPVPVELISQQKVDATLGADSLQKSFMAGLAGLIIIMVFMTLYYRLPGLLSVVSLVIYTVLNLAIFKLMGVTLTLSGIAGFILSIGMAVDTNVLVFERLKEELRLGKALKVAMEESFLRAWPSIWDSHVTTLIGCIFLIWFGSGFVQGFAVVLATGVIMSLFTAITITRTTMRLVFPWFKLEGSWLFLGFKKKNDANANG